MVALIVWHSVALRSDQVLLSPDAGAGAGVQDKGSSSLVLGDQDRQVVQLAGQVLAAACAMDLHSALQRAQASMQSQHVIGLVEEVRVCLSSLLLALRCTARMCSSLHRVMHEPKGAMSALWSCRHIQPSTGFTCMCDLICRRQRSCPADEHAFEKRQLWQKQSLFSSLFWNDMQTLTGVAGTWTIDSSQNIREHSGPSPAAERGAGN